MDGGNLFKETHAIDCSISFSAFVSNTMARKRRTVRRKRRQSKKGGARFKRKPRLVDTIAEGVAMGLSGPSPRFAKMGAFLAK